MVGRTILHYKIVEKLGESGMGVVYKAEDIQLRWTVALKFLPRETLDEEEVKARLLREAQAAAGLDHPNICQVFGIHEEDGETFIAMAYIDGPSLAEKIKNVRCHWTKLSPSPLRSLKVYTKLTNKALFTGTSNRRTSC
jgi:serine/threonine protein kinase